MTSRPSRAAPIAALLILLAAPAPTVAQVADAEGAASPVFTAAALARALRAATADASAGDGQADACDSCADRHFSRAIFSTLVLHGLYNAGNRVRGDETARISPGSWWSNLHHGFEWDDNPFMVNQLGHPYQGGQFFTAGRAWGLSFWEASAVAAFGSATWEYFGENNRASLNDIINTTAGGVALGEILHRTAWLIRDTRAAGPGRLGREIAAGIVDPLGGFARFVSGDATRLTDKPAHLVPDALSARMMSGVLWQGATVEDFERSASPFAEIDLRYGDPRTRRSRTPYETFAVRMRFGGGRPVSDVRARGTLLGRPFGDTGRYQLTVAQTYDYVSNRAYVFGGQGLEVGAGFAHPVSPNATLWLSAWGGLTALGAIDSRLPVPTDVGPTGPRDYDYGPGSTFGGAARISTAGRDVLAFAYQGHHLYVLDGLRANHVLQRGFVEWQVPFRHALSIGTSIEYFYRRTYFASGDARRDRFSQFCVYLTKTVADVNTPTRPRTTPAAPATRPPVGPRAWMVGGISYSVARSGCTTCSNDGVYRRTAGLLFNGGLRANPQLDAGLELTWIPAYLDTGEPILTSFIMGVVQYRPLRERGLFVKAGIGMAIVRNWIADPSPVGGEPRFRGNAHALAYGAGWVFRRERRVSLQVHGVHRVAALGDLTTHQTTIQNVVGNFWSIGSALVIRR